jgi:chromosomal replication initiation ATPase DnaA
VALGRLINRDHATILYYFHKVDQFKTFDPEFREKINQIELKISNHNYTVDHEQN